MDGDRLTQRPNTIDIEMSSQINHASVVARDNSLNDGSQQWLMCGRPFPRSEVKFFSQVIILYIVIITCLVNLSIANAELKSVWISLMSYAMGCILPSPSISKPKNNNINNNINRSLN